MGAVERAAAAGTVVRASVYGGYGNCVDIDHGGGIITRYGHASEIKVSVGQKVAAGQTVSLLGSTGDSSGPHLHFEVHTGGDDGNSGAIDPVPFMQARGVNLQ